MKKEQIVEIVNTFLIERLAFDARLIQPDANLKADLGLTSLDIQELKCFCQKTFGFMPDRNALFSLNLLDDVYTLIEQKQNICETI